MTKKTSRMDRKQDCIKFFNSEGIGTNPSALTVIETFCNFDGVWCKKDGEQVGRNKSPKITSSMQSGTITYTGKGKTSVWKFIMDNENQK